MTAYGVWSSQRKLGLLSPTPSVVSASCLSRSTQGLLHHSQGHWSDSGRWADSCLLLDDIRAFRLEEATVWGWYSGLLMVAERWRSPEDRLASRALCLYRYQYLYQIGQYFFWRMGLSVENSYRSFTNWIGYKRLIHSTVLNKIMNLNVRHFNVETKGQTNLEVSDKFWSNTRLDLVICTMHKQ